MRKLDFLIEPAFDGVAAANFLRREKHFSYALVVKLRHNPDCLLLDGAPIRTIDKLKAGSVLSVIIPERSGEAIPNDTLSVTILYEDEDIVVFDKPAGLPVHPAKGHQTDTLANYYAARYPCSKFRVIGRLDMDTSGLVLTAKNSHAAAVLTDETMEKQYLAVVSGTPDPPFGRIDHPIDDTDPEAHRRFVSENGRAAVTDYETVLSGKEFSLVRVMPKTGRTHQIRVHFSYIGHILLGDELYGGDREKIGRHALHRSSMTFIHPVTGEKMTFSSPLPEDMQKLVDEIMREKEGSDEQGNKKFQ